MQQRIDTVRRMARAIRRESLSMIYAAQSGHPGGSLSEADILSALYFDVLRIRPEAPKWPERDRFILSKGHACPGLYAALALRGFFPREVLGTLRRYGSLLQGHPVMQKTPGLDMTTGSLGQGLSSAVGMALAAKRDGLALRVYVLLGDGECDEGQVWEAAMTARKYGLTNLCVIIDRNGLQNDSTTAEIMPIADLPAVFAAFGWHVLPIDGHDAGAILSAFDAAARNDRSPTCIVANTVKGKGVSYMEGVCAWHAGAPSAEQYAQALRELEGTP